MRCDVVWCGMVWCGMGLVVWCSMGLMVGCDVVCVVTCVEAGGAPTLGGLSSRSPWGLLGAPPAGAVVAPVEPTPWYLRAMWCGVVWCGVVWCGVVWCGVVWCGVVWCGVVWCSVPKALLPKGNGRLVWCGVVCRRCCYQKAKAGMPTHGYM